MNAKLLRLTLILLGAFGFTAPPASAQNYPVRPVKFIVPYPAGGPNDVIARIVGQKLSEGSAGQFYVENLPGAGGTIGAGAAANAPADGYTV
jgi:tripartite-type tricarboxylate transporter receptor subunit TctC